MGFMRQRRLPQRAMQVKSWFVAVPQIEHNSTAHQFATPKNLNGIDATNLAPWTTIGNWNAMDFRQLKISHRSITVAVALAGLVSLAIGAHAALNKRSLDAAKAITTEQNSDSATNTARLALVI